MLAPAASDLFRTDAEQSGWTTVWANRKDYTFYACGGATPDGNQHASGVMAADKHGNVYIWVIM